MANAIKCYFDARYYYSRWTTNMNDDCRFCNIRLLSQSSSALESKDEPERSLIDEARAVLKSLDRFKEDVKE